MRQTARTYLDTSVFGGLFDEEYAEPTRAFFRLLREGRFVPVVSGMVLAEVGAGPEKLLAALDEALPLSETVDVDEEITELARHYLEAGVVTQKWRDDAIHVAAATVARCTLIVSWNFRHIVNFQRIPRYNAVNVLNGYAPIAIHSPAEVISYED